MQRSNERMEKGRLWPPTVGMSQMASLLTLAPTLPQHLSGEGEGVRGRKNMVDDLAMKHRFVNHGQARCTGVCTCNHHIEQQETCI